MQYKANMEVDFTVARLQCLTVTKCGGVGSDEVVSDLEESYLKDHFVVGKGTEYLIGDLERREVDESELFGTPSYPDDYDWDIMAGPGVQSGPMTEKFPEPLELSPEGYNPASLDMVSGFTSRTGKKKSKLNGGSWIKTKL
eukprot:1008916-Rhodomonas_salina.1